MINQYLSNRDWSFLNDIPARPIEFDPKANPLLSRATRSMIRLRNYMVFYKDEAEAPLQEDRTPFLRHERSLTDLGEIG